MGDSRSLTGTFALQAGITWSVLALLGRFLRLDGHARVRLAAEGKYPVDLLLGVYRPALLGKPYPP
jgi:hypothetical protein